MFTLKWTERISIEFAKLLCVYTPWTVRTRLVCESGVCKTIECRWRDGQQCRWPVCSTLRTYAHTYENQLIGKQILRPNCCFLIKLIFFSMFESKFNVSMSTEKESTKITNGYQFPLIWLCQRRRRGYETWIHNTLCVGKEFVRHFREARVWMRWHARTDFHRLNMYKYIVCMNDILAKVCSLQPSVRWFIRTLNFSHKLILLWFPPSCVGLVFKWNSESEVCVCVCDVGVVQRTIWFSHWMECVLFIKSILR